MLKFIGIVLLCVFSYYVGAYRGGVAVAETAMAHPELCQKAHDDLQPPAPLKSTSRGYVQQ